jgi:hypothetical protein
MLNEKMEHLTAGQIQVIDALIGFEEETKIKNKQVASKRLLAARRAIEAHREQKRLERETLDAWLDDDL